MLTGQVTSAEEGPMEGVVVSAKKDGSTISMSVVTSAEGRFDCFRETSIGNGCRDIRTRGESAFD